MRMNSIVGASALLAAALASPAAAQSVDPARVAATIAATFKSAPAEWQARIAQDETQKICSETRNSPSVEQAKAIEAREKSSIVFPPDGNVMGDWKKGESIAQNGRGGQFSDNEKTVNGGNCYACHQLARAEVSYGTIGPSLTEYGKIRKFDPAEAKAVYAKIYNAQAMQPCSNMPRFGFHKFLSIEQIKDLTAFLMSPESPVNK
jgi:sulfur-oxidizing protein SoxX